MDTNGDGTIDIMKGDRVGVSCAFCHAITDGSTYQMPKGGSIGKEIDGPTPHFLNVGATFATAANTRALYPIAQLALRANGGKTIGRALKGLTEKSTEAEFGAYFSNPEYYPVGMFDDAFDGNGAPMQTTPMFRADLSAPWSSEATSSKLDNFSNLVYTSLLDLSNLTTPGGRAFLHKLGGAAADDCRRLRQGAGGHARHRLSLRQAATTTTPGDGAGPIGIRVDNKKLIDMNAYMSGLDAPKGAAVGAQAKRGKETFRASCTACHQIDQGKMVGPMIVPMKTTFPGDNPVILAQRDPPLNPVQKHCRQHLRRQDGGGEC